MLGAALRSVAWSRNGSARAQTYSDEPLLVGGTVCLRVFFWLGGPPTLSEGRMSERTWLGGAAARERVSFLPIGPRALLRLARREVWEIQGLYSDSR